MASDVSHAEVPPDMDNRLNQLKASNSSLFANLSESEMWDAAKRWADFAFW